MWRYSSVWPKLFGVMDMRLVALWAASIVVNKLAIVAGFVTICFIIGRILNISPDSIRRGTMQMKKKNATPVWRQLALTVALAGGLMTQVGDAHADFRIVDSSGGWSSAGGVSGEGSPMSVPGGKYENPIIDGFGKDLPLSVILSQVLPKDYEVFYADPDVKQLRSSWQGSRPMTDILDSLAARAGVDLALDVDTKNLLVSLTNGGASGALKVNGRHAAVASNNHLRFRDWHLKKGETLSQSMYRWSEFAGWTLAWELGKDYPIQVDARVKGDLVEAVNRVAQSYHQQGAMEDVEFVFKSGNKTLVVRKFDQNITAEGMLRE